jgi:hypothetical protein
MESFYNSNFEPESYSGVRGDPTYEPSMYLRTVNPKKLYEHVRPKKRDINDFSDSLTNYMNAHPKFQYKNERPRQTYYNHEDIPSMNERIEEFYVPGPGNYVYNGKNPFEEPIPKFHKKSPTKKDHRKGGKKSRKHRRRKH